MLRTRNWFPAATLAIFAVASPAGAGVQPVDYGTAELGEIRTACARISGPATITSLTVDAPFFIRGIRLGQAGDGTAVCDNIPGLTTPTQLPKAITSSQQLVFDVDLVPTELGSQHSFLYVNQNPNPDASLEAFVAPVTSCVPSGNALCLSNDRFKTRVHWRTDFGTRGSGGVVPFGSDDSGLFYFFNANNWEVLIKVLNACTPPFDRFWVFAAATTNVEYTITVTDTESDEVKTYFKPQGPPAPAVTDTSAFATCP